DRCGRLTRGEKTRQAPFLDDRRRRGRDALVVEGEAAQAAGRRRVGGDVHVLGAVLQRAEVVRLDETRACIRRLGSIDAVELRRMADALVHLERDLVGVEHGVSDAARARVGAHERGRLPGDARRLLDEPEAVYVLPARLAARAAVRTGVAPQLEDAVARGGAVHAGAALREDLLDLGSL